MGPKNLTTCQEKREKFPNVLLLSEGRDPTGNSFEKMISQWGQIVMNAHPSPLVFDS
jgi:hypothetical protein